MTEHAEGPWANSGEFSHAQDEIVDALGRAVCIVWTRRPRVDGATVRECFKDDEQGKANARLIIAAPDLLAALVHTLDALCNETAGQDDSPWLKEVKWAADRAITAAKEGTA